MSGSGAHGGANASPWIERFAALVRPGGRVLDVAAGAGRHTRLFMARGHPVLALDRDAALLEQGGASERLCADLEAAPWPLAGTTFAAVVVTNYLHRPLIPALRDAVEAGGVLLYETFARGNERFGRPSHPDHLLESGELLHWFADWTIVAYEHGTVTTPRPACISRVCAVKTVGSAGECFPLDPGAIS